MGQPRVVAMAADRSSGQCMGINPDLWKLMARPVARAKESRMVLRVAADWGSARQRIRVSSAYWSTGQGSEGSIG